MTLQAQGNMNAPWTVAGTWEIGTDAMLSKISVLILLKPIESRLRVFVRVVVPGMSDYLVFAKILDRSRHSAFIFLEHPDSCVTVTAK